MKASLTLDGAIRYAELISNEIDKANLIINGEEKTKELYRKKVDGNTITILIYLQDNDIGVIENIQLIAEDGTILHERADIIKKDGREGFLVGFKFYIKGEIKQ